MLNHQKPTFLEKPVTDDEKSIAQVVGNLYHAVKRHDTNLLLSLFFDDARIFSTIANGFISKAEYAKHMECIWSKILVWQLYDLQIRITDERAFVVGLSRYVYTNMNTKSWWRELQFRKEEGGWRIAESVLRPL